MTRPFAALLLVLCLRGGTGHGSPLETPWRAIAKPSLSCGSLTTTDCQPDCASAIVTRMRECSAAGGGTLSLGAGVYHLRGVSADFAATLTGVSAVVLTGPSGTGEPTATLMLHGLLGGFHLVNTTALQFARITIDMYRLPYTYGKVSSVAKNSFTMSYDHATYDFPAGAAYTWLLGVQGVAEFNHTGNTWLSQGLDIFEWGPTYPTIQLLASGELKVVGLGASQGVKAGSWLIVRHHCYGLPAFKIDNSAQTVLRQVTLLAAPGMGVLGTDAKDVTLDQVRIERKAGRPLSISADGAHFASCTGDIILRDCHFEGQGDDGLNIHGNFAQVERISAGRRQVSLGAGPAQEGFEVLAGETYEFRDRRTWEVLARAVAVSGGSMQVQLDRALPSAVGAYALVSIAERGPRALVQRSYFGNNRARGVLVKTSNALIEDCTFENTLGPAVQSYPDGCFWFESAAFTNWTLRNSTIISANRDPNWSNDQLNVSEYAVGDVIIAACAVDWVDGAPDNCSGASVQGRHLRSCGNPVACAGCFPFSGITIEGNRFVQSTEGQPHPALTIWGVDGLQLNNNHASHFKRSGGQFMVSNSRCTARANQCGAEPCVVKGCEAAAG